MPEQVIQKIVQMLDEVLDTAKSIPPVDNAASRFGNPAFKTFYDRVKEVSCKIVRTTVSLVSKTEFCYYNSG